MADQLDQQLHQVTALLNEDFPPISPGEIETTEIDQTATPPVRRPMGPVVAVVALAVVLVIFGGLWMIRSEPAQDPVATTVSPVPTTTTPQPTTMPVQEAKTWGRATGLPIPEFIWSGGDFFVFNGSTFLAMPDAMQDISQGDLYRSEDGIDWVQVASPVTVNLRNAWLIAVDDQFVLAAEGGFKAGTSAVRKPGSDNWVETWVSADGLDWTPVESNIRPFHLMDHQWHVSDYETVLSARPSSYGLDSAYSVVMQFGDTLLQYRTGYVDPTRPFEAWESTDGTTFTLEADLPPFASTLTDEYLSAGWQWMWRCEVAAENSTAMMLVTDNDTTALWTSDDGNEWTRLADPPQDDNPARSQCITAIDNGWLLTPGGHIIREPEGEKITGTPSEVYYSKDATTWTPISVPDEYVNIEGWIEVAGNRIFVVDPTTKDLVVGSVSR